MSPKRRQPLAVPELIAETWPHVRFVRIVRDPGDAAQETQSHHHDKRAPEPAAGFVTYLLPRRAVSLHSRCAHVLLAIRRE